MSQNDTLKTLSVGVRTTQIQTMGRLFERPTFRPAEIRRRAFITRLLLITYEFRTHLALELLPRRARSLLTRTKTIAASRQPGSRAM